MTLHIESMLDAGFTLAGPDSWNVF